MQKQSNHHSFNHRAACSIATTNAKFNRSQPKKNEATRAFQKQTKLLLRALVKTLERKFVDKKLEHWGYKQAAAEFHNETGCSLRSAEKYFYHIQDIAEWRHILERDITFRDFYLRIGRPVIRLP